MTSFIGLIFGFISIYFLAAIFVPKKVLFFISDEEQRKRWIGIVGLFLSYLVTFAILSSTDEYKEEAKKDALNELANTRGTDEWFVARYEQAKKDSATISNLNVDTVKFYDMGLNGMVKFATYIRNYHTPDSLESTNDELSSLFLQNKKRCDEIFKSCEVRLRKDFAKKLGDDLWEHNIYTKVEGKDATTLWLRGGIYANNKNIKDSQNELEDKLKALGFKKVCYKWIEHASEYTFYNLE